MTAAELTAACDQARELATARPTARNRAALKKAQAALDAFQAQAIAPTGSGQNFASVEEFVLYLNNQGYKIGKSAAYDHWKKEGKIKARPDGSFSRAEVESYAVTYLQRKDGAPPTESTAQAKARAEIRRIASDADMRELKYRAASGELIPRSQVEVELADRASHLKGYLDAVARSAAGHIVKLVKGDPQLAPDLIAFLLGTNRKAFDNYSRPIIGLEEEED